MKLYVYLTKNLGQPLVWDTFGVISVCSFFLETKLDQTDTSSDSTISDADQSSDDGKKNHSQRKKQ